MAAACRAERVQAGSGIAAAKSGAGKNHAAGTGAVRAYICVRSSVGHGTVSDAAYHGNDELESGVQ